MHNVETMTLTLPNCRLWTTSELPQGSDQWHAERATRLTASNADKLLTPKKLEPSKSINLAAQEVAMCHVRQLYSVKLSNEFRGNKATDWGHEMEPVARAAFAEGWRRGGGELHEFGFISRNGLPFGCSPDGILSMGGVICGGLEIKCPSSLEQIGRCWLGSRPGVDDYKLQCLFSMWVTGLPEWTLLVYAPGCKLLPGKNVFTFYRHEHEQALAAIENAAGEWHRLMLGYYNEALAMF